MYDKSDPRASLAPAKTGSMLSVTGLVAEPQHALCYETAPQIDDGSGQSWLHRAHNFLTAYTVAKPGGTFARKRQVDEYCVLLPGAGASITWNGETIQVPGFSIAFVPPGDSTVTLPEGGELVRLFTTQNADLAEAVGIAPPVRPTPLDQDGLLGLFDAKDTGADYQLVPATDIDMRGTIRITPQCFRHDRHILSHHANKGIIGFFRQFVIRKLVDKFSA